MKAAVLHQFGQAPCYEDFPDPVAGDGELLVAVKAVALENIDKFMARGEHYAARQFLPSLPAIVGGGGGVTPEAIAEGTQQVWEWLKAGTLHYDLEIVPLKDIERAWQRSDLRGKRLVIVP